MPTAWGAIGVVAGSRKATTSNSSIRGKGGIPSWADTAYGPTTKPRDHIGGAGRTNAMASAKLNPAMHRANDRREGSAGGQLQSGSG